jgi:hypothetical protein
VVDSGGASRKLKDPWVVDSGGVSRKLKKIWVIDPTGTARLVFRSADVLSMFVGGPVADAVGYVPGSIGSLTPTTLGDGSVVQEITISNHLSPTPFELAFEINGYPGTIVEGYLTSISVDGSVFTPGGTGFVSFSGGSPGGTAQWLWTGAAVPTVGSTIPVIVMRT